MDNKGKLELRSVETERQFKWLVLMAKEPELAALMQEIASLSQDDKRFIIRMIKSTMESLQLYQLAKHKSVMMAQTPNSDLGNPRFNITNFDI